MHIYLDYNASTSIDPTVAAAMEPFLHVSLLKTSSNPETLANCVGWA